MSTFELSDEYELVNPGCGCEKFAMPKSTVARWRRQRTRWHCPTCGDGRVFTGKTKEEKQLEQVDALNTILRDKGLGQGDISAWIDAVERAEKAEVKNRRLADELRRVQESAEQVLHVGDGLSNAAFNLSQDERIEQRYRHSLKRGQMEWDEAAKAFRRALSTPEPQDEQPEPDTTEQDGTDDQLGVVAYARAHTNALTAQAASARVLAHRVARLNPDAGEIGEGMLRSLVEDARTITQSK